MADVLLTRDGRPAAALWPASGFVHLNHGSYGRVPLAAVDHQQRLRQEMEHGTARFMARAPERVRRSREEIAPFLGVDAQLLALVPNASAGVSTALRSMPLPAGSEVVVTDHAYGAVRMGVDRAAREAGAAVKVATVPLDADAETAADAIWSVVTERTAMIVLDQITSPTARLLPVGEVCARARARGIVTVVDGAHAPLLLTDPVRAAGADVWVGNLHKFASTPRGTAALVAHEGVADRLRPLIDSWGAPHPYPHRFDQQGSDDYTAWLTAPMALHHLEDELGWDRIRAHATSMAERAVARVSEALADTYDDDPAVQVGMPVGPIRLAGLPAAVAVRPDELRARFIAAGFEATFTEHDGRLFWRVSPHAYTTEADLDELIERGLALLSRASTAVGG
ncbi:aminotransferase class V-fold PLP-dependent enzyme [Pseudactinotalea suaedae]|uniref:aminotransferase class V-fold PLP-dependent enzyme n=1 Tax=Pseudactinotalea suaedae TaxID=1524924 RepID=UPI0012E138A7|nr:aminotransferase class V-fold PLP-dependent enzyme [Pseudactinotalea suaedae]